MTMIWSTPIFFETSSYFPAIETDRNWAYNGIDPNPDTCTSKLLQRVYTFEARSQETPPMQDHQTISAAQPQLLLFLHAENDVQNMSQPAKFGGNKHLLVGN